MKTRANHKKQFIWAIVLTVGLVLFFATGCKPKEIIQERTVTKMDSTAVYSLQEENTAKSIVIENLQRELDRTREENIKLLNEVSRYETYYDTDKPIVPETGKPPVSSEITTISSSQLEKNLKEQVKLNAEYRIENETLTRINRNQELIIQSLIEENRDLKEKTIPTTGFNIKLFLIGVGTGILLIILLLIFIRR